MDFHSLSRRELQALCKSKGIRANMSNAAMAEALQCLPSVDGTDEIGSTAPPPPMSAVKEVPIIEEQTHGSLLPRGGRARAKTRIVAAGNTEEDVPDQATLTLQVSQRTAARKAAVAPEPEEAIAEKQEHGCPLPRGGRARGKTRKAGARKTEEEVAPAPHTLPGNKRTVAEEAATPVDAEEVATAPVDAQEVAVETRTRRSARSKVKIALDEKEKHAQVRKEHKVSDRSCDDSEEHVVAVVAVEEEIIKPQEGQNVTRRATLDKTHEDLQQDPRTVEEVATVKKRMRRSTRSKVAAAAQKGEKADSSDTTVGPEVDPKDDEVVRKVEEAPKPQEGKNVTRRAAVYKEQEVVQTGQVTAAPEAMAAVEAEEAATAKRRRRRRSARSKVRVAARKGQKADPSDAVNGPTVSDDPKEEQVVEVVEEWPTKPNKEEREQISNVCQIASLPKLEDSPILGVVSKPNASDASDKAPVADEEPIKEDGFTFTGEADVSNLLVDTLDRFAKPMYGSKDEQEKKGSQCWWMLL